jgi:hypothetical protein
MTLKTTAEKRALWNALLEDNDEARIKAIHELLDYIDKLEARCNTFDMVITFIKDHEGERDPMPPAHT